MRAIIFAAGEGKRMRPLTENVPKPMLPLLGKPLLEHLLESLPKEIDEVVLVVGYRAEKIREYFGERFGRFHIRYVYQEKPLGTAHALTLARKHLSKGRFLSLYADDLHGREDFEHLLEHPLSVLVKKVKNPERFGVVALGKKGAVVSITEKPSQPESDLVVTGPAVLDERIFDYEPMRHDTGEYFLSEAIGMMVREHPVKAVEQVLWIPIGYPEDLARAEALLASVARERKLR